MIREALNIQLNQLVDRIEADGIDVSNIDLSIRVIEYDEKTGIETYTTYTTEVLLTEDDVYQQEFRVKIVKRYNNDDLLEEIYEEF